VSVDILDILYKDGFILAEEDSNLIRADKAFFAVRVIEWIREHANDPDFNLQAYLVGLTYYKLGLGELKFTEDGDLFYRYIGVQGVGEYVDKMGDRDSEDLGGFHRPSEPAPEKGTESPADDGESP
jgi:hypothetical protein